jgi:hypothetical protein
MARKELTPNVDVGYFETMAFNMAGMAYEQYLRELVIEKIDDPNNLWDDRVLAMFDALFGGE